MFFWQLCDLKFIPLTIGIDLITDYITKNLGTNISQINSANVKLGPTATVNCPQGFNLSSTNTFNLLKSFNENSIKSLHDQLINIINGQQMLINIFGLNKTQITDTINNYLTATTLNKILNDTYTVQGNNVIINSPIADGVCKVDQNFLIRLFSYNLLEQIGNNLQINPNATLADTEPLTTSTKRTCLQNNQPLENLLQEIKNIYSSVLSHQTSLQFGFTQIRNQLRQYHNYEIDPGIVSLTTTSSTDNPPNKPLVTIVKRYRLCDPTRILIFNISLAPLDNITYLAMHQRKGAILYRNNQLRMSDESLESL